MCVYTHNQYYLLTSILAWVWTRQGVTINDHLDNTEIAEYSLVLYYS